MIIQKLYKVNIYTKQDRINVRERVKVERLIEEIQKYENTINFGYMKCPDCESDKLIGYGYYERNIGINDKFEKIRIKRVQCTKCERTHAIIPSFIYPFFQYEKSYINYVIMLIRVREKKHKQIQRMIKLSRQLILKWKKRFEMCESRLKVLFKTHNIREIINKILCEEFEEKYRIENRLRYFETIPT